MKLSAPKQITWLVALVAGALGVVSHYHIVSMGPLAPYAFFLLAGAWALLLIAALLKGL